MKEKSKICSDCLLSTHTNKTLLITCNQLIKTQQIIIYCTFVREILTCEKNSSDVYVNHEHYIVGKYYNVNIVISTN